MLTHCDICVKRNLFLQYDLRYRTLCYLPIFKFEKPCTILVCLDECLVGRNSQCFFVPKWVIVCEFLGHFENLCWCTVYLVLERDFSTRKVCYSLTQVCVFVCVCVCTYSRWAHCTCEFAHPCVDGWGVGCVLCWGGVHIWQHLQSRLGMLIDDEPQWLV